MAFGQGVSVLPVAGVHEARASRAVEGGLVGGADPFEAEDELAQVVHNTGYPCASAYSHKSCCMTPPFMSGPQLGVTPDVGTVCV